ncbi:MAG TPA: hypothetical protein PLV72_04390 [Candidatus Magasanikbacteria bacterium]|nr:hypothetical protein [Candidatus Magasanikbacteria bacterium]
MPITEAEKKELEFLDNPQVQLGTPASGAIAFLAFNTLNKRKERVTELRTKLRMEELGLNENKDWQKFYEIRAEEEKRFDERFGS